MKGLQDELVGHPAIRLVTFTVDPERDDPARLTTYAKERGADPERWLFLTGKQEEIYTLLADGFKLHAAQNEGAERKPGQEVVHTTRLVLVHKKEPHPWLFREHSGDLRRESRGRTEGQPQETTGAGDSPARRALMRQFGEHIE